MIGLLIAGVMLQVVPLVVLHTIVALVTREEPDDERIVAIQQRSARASGVVLSVGVWLVVGLTVAQGLVGSAEVGSFASPIITGHVLLACFIVAELTRMTHAAVLYRRG